MAAKKISILATLLAIGASHFSFAAQGDEQFDVGYPEETISARYTFIESMFDSQTNQFEDGYFRRKHDIAVVKDHKAALEKEMKEMSKTENSWAPLFLKIAGVGFSIGAGKEALAAFLNVLPSYSPIDNALNNLHRYMRYASLSVNIGIVGKIGNNLYELTEPGIVRDLSFASLRVGDSLIAANIAAWLFKKANSYQEAIERLKKQITTDEQMLKALPNVPIKQ